MNTKKEIEALRLADGLEGNAKTAWTREEAAAELRRLHAENTTLQQGYDAARLEIEALRSRQPPAGWVMAPVVPTEDMKCAAVKHLHGNGVHYVQMYKAMLAAAPKAEPVMFNGLTEEETMETASCAGLMTQPVGEYPALPEPTFKLWWDSKNARYTVSKPNIGDTDVFAADQMRAYGEACWKAGYKQGAWADAQPAGAQQPGTATWMPLPGTLPEAGKPVLLDIGKKYPIRAMWAAKHTVQAADDDSDWGEYDEATDTYYCPEGWYEWNEHEDVHWRVDKTPVAWCELPSKEQK